MLLFIYMVLIACKITNFSLCLFVNFFEKHNILVGSFAHTALTLKPARKYKQISTENAYADKSAFLQCLKQNAITLKRLHPQSFNLCQ